MELTQIIRKPILTEKTNNLQQNNVYTFEVDWAANKYQIKHAVELIFQVKVKNVKTLKMDKKPKRLGRFNGFTNRYKKAMVSLKEGYTINYYPEDVKKEAEEKAKKAAQKAKAKTESDEAKAKEAELMKKLAAKKAKKNENKNKVSSAAGKKTTTRKTANTTKKEK